MKIKATNIKEVAEAIVADAHERMSTEEVEFVKNETAEKGGGEVEPEAK